MLTLDDLIRSQIHEHAKEEMPKEACGVLLYRGTDLGYRRIKNISPASFQFVMDAEEYAAAEDEGVIAAIVHSHPYMPAIASQPDRVGCVNSGLPWLIVGYPTLQEGWIYPDKMVEEPYLERVFAYGVLDCYTLASDFYRREYGIALPDRGTFADEWEWWLKGKDLYSLQTCFDAGFVRVNDAAKYGDLHFMCVRSPHGVANHIGIQLDQGHFIHHLMGQLSSKTVYGGYWEKHTKYTIRHKTKCN